MELQFDTNKEYALSLQGGGARGAYQIGAWKALKEAGFKIVAVAGTSVGALNGALITMDDLDKAIGIWQELSYSNVIDVDDKIMSDVVNKKLGNEVSNKILSADNASEIKNEIKGVIEQGKNASRGFDTTPLRKMLEKYVDAKKIINSDIELFIVTCMPYWAKHQDTKGTTLGALGFEKDVSNRDVKEEELIDYLLASSNLPLFKNQKLNDDTYRDGGYVNVMPDNVLLERGYQSIISIRLPSFGMHRKCNYTEAPIVIEPRGNIGEVIEFENSRIRENLELGYYDAMKVIYGLRGRDYYFDGTISEDEAAYFFTKHGREFCEMFEDVYNRRKRERLNSFIPPIMTESVEKIENSLKVIAAAKPLITGPNKKPSVGKEKYVSKSRKAFELYYPKFAVNSLKLKPDWTYQQIYIAVIEKIMSVLGAEKFKIYTLEDIEEALKTFNRKITVETNIYEEIKKQSVEQEILFNLAVMLVDDKCTDY